MTASQRCSPPGRRFAIANAAANPFASASGFGFTNAVVEGEGKHLTVDFGISIPLQLNDADGGDGQIQPQDLGPITVAVAVAGDVSTDNPAVAPGVREGQVLAHDQYQVVGVLDDYASAAWLRSTGGLVDFDIPAGAAALIVDHPLLMLIPTSGQSGLTVAIRESIGGLWMRADDFVQRLDTAPSGWVGQDVAIRAMRWGERWADAPIALSLPPVTQQGGADTNEVKPPQADIPDNNVPLAKFSVPPTASTGPDGIATVTYWAQDPGNPRGYIDGQIYQIAYAPAVVGASPMPMFEVVVSHVRDAYTPPKVPSWDTDVRPVLVQYSNLYPIMSHGLFSLSDFDTVAGNAKLLHLAFTLPMSDPNFMPATRDISAGKLRMIVDWLTSYMPHGSPAGYGAIPPLPVGGPLPVQKAAVTPSATAPPKAAPASEVIDALGPGNDGKTAAARAFMRNAARNRGG